MPLLLSPLNPSDSLLLPFCIYRMHVSHVSQWDPTSSALQKFWRSSQTYKRILNSLFIRWLIFALLLVILREVLPLGFMAVESPNWRVCMAGWVQIVLMCCVVQRAGRKILLYFHHKNSTLFMIRKPHGISIDSCSLYVYSHKYAPYVCTIFMTVYLDIHYLSFNIQSCMYICMCVN